ncbi:AbrB/MazE/SpoVT family DNA-binding domain-containing protein [Mesorhizobium sp. RP14(2022)]|uniref:AbrB/MazE/SpoVT family DNA-binding domain-containing protein n=1 Tax=Mesorhizobium liriopis TaxID=2953882 RepID=A0ABT1C007_9HYPH|nr:AbrB/MazE/SpoVT family DNA-binding domain-containing protein [Mesorhizobium liriopis]MCO6048183.1 AbrB/MazE/SpoVT family DNA-binding domain-containing protein [Mesorhizobium liriopis]
MRVTSKGQVTIPKEIRDRMKIGPGSEVDFVVSGNVVELVALSESEGQRRRARSIRAWGKKMAGTLHLGGMTTEEYIEVLRGPRADLDPR